MAREMLCDVFQLPPDEAERALRDLLPGHNADVLDELLASPNEPLPPPPLPLPLPGQTGSSDGSGGGGADGGGSAANSVGASAAAKRGRGRPVKQGGGYSKEYERLRAYRQRNRESVAGLEAALDAAGRELAALSLQRDYLRMKEEVLRECVRAAAAEDAAAAAEEAAAQSRTAMLPKAMPHQSLRRRSC